MCKNMLKMKKKKGKNMLNTVILSKRDTLKKYTIFAIEGLANASTGKHSFLFLRLSQVFPTCI